MGPCLLHQGSCTQLGAPRVKVEGMRDETGETGRVPAAEGDMQTYDTDIWECPIEEEDRADKSIENVPVTAPKHMHLNGATYKPHTCSSGTSTLLCVLA